VQEGTLNGDKVFLGTHDAGGSNLVFTDQTTPTASETVPGVVEKATEAEVRAATDTGRYVAPIDLGRMIQAKSFSLGDDAATSFPLPASRTGLGILGGSAAFSAVFMWDTGTPGIAVVFEGTSGADIDYALSALTGTTGADTNFTIGLNANTLYLENRLGGGFSGYLYLIGAG